MTAAEDFISHYGKKGMRWGVRKQSKNSAKSSSDHKKVAEIRRKKTHQLTNNQLRAHNERLNLEIRFNQMNPSKRSKGAAKVKGVLSTATAAATVYNLVKSPAGQAAISAGKMMLKKKP